MDRAFVDVERRIELDEPLAADCREEAVAVNAALPLSDHIRPTAHEPPLPDR